jgi:sugar/nucleoside kinase (ribokinase family)
LLSELTAFITNEVDIRSLFKGHQTDLWEMAYTLAGFGPEYVLIETSSQGYYLFDRISGKRWMVPNYPAKAVDPTGCRDAFAGGFLAGYRKSYDALEGAMKGSIAASLVLEGSGPFFALDAMPGLVDLRLEALQERVQEI